MSAMSAETEASIRALQARLNQGPPIMVTPELERLIQADAGHKGKGKDGWYGEGASAAHGHADASAAHGAHDSCWEEGVSADGGDGSWDGAKGSSWDGAEGSWDGANGSWDGASYHGAHDSWPAGASDGASGADDCRGAGAEGAWEGGGSADSWEGGSWEGASDGWKAADDGCWQASSSKGEAWHDAAKRPRTEAHLRPKCGVYSKWQAARAAALKFSHLLSNTDRWYKAWLHANPKAMNEDFGGSVQPNVEPIWKYSGMHRVLNNN